MPVPRERVLDSVDRVLKGRLTDEWRKQVEGDLSYESFARWLANEHDVHVTGNTVRTWVQTEQLPITKGSNS